MNATLRLVVHALLFVLGIVLLVGGLVTAKHGATVIGVILAAVNIKQFLSEKKATAIERTGHAH